MGLLVLLLLLLKVLEGGLHLQAFLQVVKGRVLQAAIADKVVELVASFDNIQIQNVIEAHDILLLQDANVAIDIQVFQVLFPHIKANDSNDVAQDLLKGCPLSIVLVSPIQRALDYDRVKVGEHLVFLKNHGARPGAIVDSKVEDPLVRRSLPNVT